jgi:PAS domain S-box-containing protein
MACDTEAAVARFSERALAGEGVFLLMEDAARVVCGTLRIEFAEVVELTPEGALVLRAGAGWGGEAAEPEGADSPGGYALRAREPVIIEDLASEQRFAVPRRLCDAGIASGVLVAAGVRDAPFGVLGAYARAHRRFANNEIHFLQSIANVLAAAVERKRIERRLRQSERLYRTMTSNLPGAVVALFDRDLRYIVVDGPELLASLGLSKEGIEGKTVAEAFPNAAPVITPIYRAVLEGETVTRELEFSGRVYLTRTAPVRDEGGEVIAGAATALDITGRKRMEEALREQEGQLRLALDAGRMGTWDWDVRTGELKWSAALESLHGLAPGAFPGTYGAFLELIHPEDRRAFEATVAEALGAEKPFQTEFRVVHPDGSIHWIAGRGQVFLDEFGAPARMIGIGLDVTERKQAEENLARSNRELEQFAYIASHDLREPLRMVKSYVQLLERRYRGRLDEEAREFIAFAVDGVTRMQQMIDGLLELSRAAKTSAVLRPTDSSAALDRALQNLKPMVEESGAVVTRGRLPKVPADPVQLTEVLQNLVSNGIKFRGEELPRVEVAAERRGGEWVFSVRDNGIGIEHEQAGRIFEIFQRLNERGRYSGVGIGLAVTKRIIERHGGRIWVESEPGRGATFYFTLPAQKTA